MNAADICALLEERYHRNLAHVPEWIIAHEFMMGSGTLCSRRIDMWAIHTAPSKGNRSIAYEIKVSRSDFRRDLKNLDKHIHARLFSDQFFYVAPVGVIKVDELPDWAGLIEIDPDATLPTFKRVRPVREAPFLSKHAPSWPVVISLLRRVKPDDENPSACPECPKYAGKCPACHRRLPTPAERLLERQTP